MKNEKRSERAQEIKKDRDGNTVIKGKLSKKMRKGDSTEGVPGNSEIKQKTKGRKKGGAFSLMQRRSKKAKTTTQ